MITSTYPGMFRVIACGYEHEYVRHDATFEPVFIDVYAEVLYAVTDTAADAAKWAQDAAKWFPRGGSARIETI